MIRRSHHNLPPIHPPLASAPVPSAVEVGRRDFYRAQDPLPQTTAVDVDVIAPGSNGNAAVPATYNYRLDKVDLQQVVRVELLAWKVTRATANPDPANFTYQDNIFLLDLKPSVYSDIPVGRALILPDNFKSIRSGMVMLNVSKPPVFRVNATDTYHLPLELGEEFAVPRLIWEDPENRGMPVQNIALSLHRMSTSPTAGIGIDQANAQLQPAVYDELYLWLRFHTRSRQPKTVPAWV